MFAKRQRQYEIQDLPKDKRFRANLSELFLDNTISADRTLSLLEDAQAAGTRHLNDLARPNPYKGKSKFRKNAGRDLRRRLLKGSPWPELYYADIRVWDNASQTEQTVTCPMMLPHEIFHCLCNNNSIDEMLSCSSMSKRAAQHLHKMKEQFKVSKGAGLGLWIDGAPCNWDRTQSLECISLSFPGLQGSNKNLRVPITVLNRRFIIKDQTFEDILDVVAWSFICLSNGCFPVRRHDGTSWGDTDKQRRKDAGQSFGCSAFLVEMRGDWKMFAEILKVPVYNTKSGCCCKCNIKYECIRDFNSNASWKQPENRLSHWQFVNRVLQSGHAISNLFKCPGFDTSCIALDWLHVVDIGVAADFLGNLFWALLPLQDGNTKAARVSSLFVKIQAFYQANNVDNRLKTLTKLMLRKKPSASPKIRASASEARALIAFAKHEAEASLDPTNMYQQTILEATLHLHSCYSMLAHNAWDKTSMEMHCVKFCILYKALEAYATAADKNLWRVKPKMHLFQELCFEDANPSDSWTYRDEDFGGYLAASSRCRGGKATIRSVNVMVLNNFRAKFQPHLKP